jgi:hypothetical protein
MEDFGWWRGLDRKKPGIREQGLGTRTGPLCEPIQS